MPIFKGETDLAGFRKFLRIKDTIVIANPEDIKVDHESLAEKDGLSEELRKMINENPDEVDAGTAIFAESPCKNPTIRLKDKSHTLDIPKTKRARERTVEVFRKQTPGCDVKNVGRLIFKAV